MRKADIPDDLLREIQLEAIDDYLCYRYGIPGSISGASQRSGSAELRQTHVPEDVLLKIEKNLDDFLAVRHLDMQDLRRQSSEENELDAFLLD